MAEWLYSKNGQQQGPVSAAMLKQMADRGQIQPDDFVWKEGMAEWVKASRLKGLFGPPESAATAAVRTQVPPPPPLPVSSAPYAAPAAFVPQYAAPYGQYGQYAQPVTNSGLAIASLVCGLLFCVPFCSILAIIFGILGIIQTKDGQRGGRGLAIAGLVLGLLSTVLSISVLLPALTRARGLAKNVVSATYERQISIALSTYCITNRGMYPPDLATLAKTQNLSTTIFVNPASNDTPASTPETIESGGHCSYIYVGQKLKQPVPASLVVLYEKPGLHGSDGSNVLFGDGHVEFISKARLPGVLAPAV